MIHFRLFVMLACGFAFSARAAEWGNLQAMPGYAAAFDLSTEVPVSATLLTTSAPGNIFHPQESPAFSVQLFNKEKTAIACDAHWEVIRYDLRGVPGDNWWPEVVRLEVVGRQAVRVDLASDAWVNVEVVPPASEMKGGYAVILDLGDNQRVYVTSWTRTFRPDGIRHQYPKQALEEMPPAILERMGVQAVRFGIPYIPSERKDAVQRWESLAQELAEYHAHGVTCTVEIGCADYRGEQPLGRGRPHLDDQGIAKNGKQDQVWLPSYDDDYQQFCYRIASEFGWPGGPVTSFMLWNEPWEGQSISGWGADMIRYRELYRRMGDAIFKARAEAGVDVLIGGCDSSTNTWDKLFPDGDFETWLPYLDFCSIHYQGLSSPVLHPEWNNRTQHKGRVLIWDTESWVANSVDRIPGVVAANRAVGYDRSMGHLSRISISNLSHNRVAYDTIKTETGSEKRPRLLESRPTAAAIGAVQHFVGEREFDSVLFERGLPWIYSFRGLNDRADDGTVVLVGDLQSLFGKPSLWSSVKSLAGRARHAALIAERLTADAARQKKIDGLLAIDPFVGVTFSVRLPKGCMAYDGVGNPLVVSDGVVTLPVDDRGFYLRGDPQIPGSYAALLDAMRSGVLVGLEPVHLLAADAVGPDLPFRLRLTNMLTRPVRGNLEVSIAGIPQSPSAEIELAPHGQEWLDIPHGTMRPDNRYETVIRFVSTTDGVAELRETLHINTIHARSIVVDGDLGEWAGCMPQIVGPDQAVGKSVEEAMWTPFVDSVEGAVAGTATLWFAANDEGFSFAAKIVDATPYAGTLRFANRDQDADFYPAEAIFVAKDGTRQALTWPAGVRRFSYRRWPATPMSMPQNKADNILLAFNAIPIGEDGLLASLPGRPTKFIAYGSTDYEFAFNLVHDDFGGGTEVWRAQVPGMPRKHFFPRQPAHVLEGPASSATCVIRYENGFRVVEGMLPWSEIPHVQALRSAGTPVALAIRIYDTQGPTVDSNAGRSVCEGLSHCFHPDWRAGDPNEVQFGWERP